MTKKCSEKAIFDHFSVILVIFDQFSEINFATTCITVHVKAVRLIGKIVSVGASLFFTQVVSLHNFFKSKCIVVNQRFDTYDRKLRKISGTGRNLTIDFVFLVTLAKQNT